MLPRADELTAGASLELPNLPRMIYAANSLRSVQTLDSFQINNDDDLRSIGAFLMRRRIEV
jgi:hypothetical protein